MTLVTDRVHSAMVPGDVARRRLRNHVSFFQPEKSPPSRSSCVICTTQWTVVLFGFIFKLQRFPIVFYIQSVPTAAQTRTGVAHITSCSTYFWVCLQVTLDGSSKQTWIFTDALPHLVYCAEVLLVALLLFKRPKSIYVNFRIFAQKQNFLIDSRNWETSVAPVLLFAWVSNGAGPAVILWIAKKAQKAQSLMIQTVKPFRM